ncbi:tRNA-specific adenosine deaminase [Wigglesworthia glossinidia endosymbiont of Glossina morsitans morsitans (Yale colony)]|uniref:tRNA-specific adenosine deaminase n=2 Tax=Wigglesworthia glossinidia TaxID=51229 RepID=H6Q5H5_WIGGL|nr:tRNA-specific adenosine deaminase [Wigglesworthia glossinidia endosymbiont of Glossina morsitans morsitans (Yale colony)]
MSHAIFLAHQASNMQEVPIGSVVVLNNKIIGEGWNQSISRQDPSAHAEIIALRQAAKYMSNYRLINAEIYTTIEPCIMCIGAIINARIDRLIFGARKKNRKNLFIEKLLNSNESNHHFVLTEGVLAKECSEAMHNFFYCRRIKY